MPRTEAVEVVETEAAAQVAVVAMVEEAKAERGAAEAVTAAVVVGTKAAVAQTLAVVATMVVVVPTVQVAARTVAAAIRIAVVAVPTAGARMGRVLREMARVRMADARPDRGMATQGVRGRHAVGKPRRVGGRLRVKLPAGRTQLAIVTANPRRAGIVTKMATGVATVTRECAAMAAIGTGIGIWKLATARLKLRITMSPWPPVPQPRGRREHCRS